jgi:hypothetical protein
MQVTRTIDQINYRNKPVNTVFRTTDENQRQRVFPDIQRSKNAESDLSMLDKFDKNIETMETFFHVDKNKKMGGSTFFNEVSIN